MKSDYEVALRAIKAATVKLAMGIAGALASELYGILLPPQLDSPGENHKCPSDNSSLGRLKCSGLYQYWHQDLGLIQLIRHVLSTTGVQA